MSSRLTPRPGDFVRSGTNLSDHSNNFSLGSNRTTQSTAYDSTEVVFTTSTNTIEFDKKGNLMQGGRLADGIQTVDIPKWTNVVKVFLGEKAKDEASVFYTTVRLPKKVRRNRLLGHYTQLYIRAARPETQGAQDR
jgi:hypothetical protein